MRVTERMQSNVEVDQPKSLAYESVRKHRVGLLNEAHIVPLTKFVKRLRLNLVPGYDVPFFDPFDGGTAATVLFVLEAPGPKAIQSGFVSRNNPDETAKNMFTFLIEAGFQREDTVLWNIVPWYIGSGTKIRPAYGKDIQDGMPHLEQVIGLLPALKIIALVGKKAGKAKSALSKISGPPIVETFHPSPQFVNRNKGNRVKIIDAFRKIRFFLK